MTAGLFASDLAFAGVIVVFLWLVTSPWHSDTD